MTAVDASGNSVFQLVGDTTGVPRDTKAVDVDVQALLARLPRRVRLTENFTSAVTSFGIVPQLVLPVKANKLYYLKGCLFYSTDTTTTGIGLSFAHPGVDVFTVGVTICGINAGGTTHVFQNTLNPSGGTTTQAVSGQVNVINTRYPVDMFGMVRPSADGDISLQFRSEVDASVATLYADSWLELLES